MVLKNLQNLGTPVTTFFKKKTFMEWNDYSNYVQQMDDFLWRQSVRQESIANL